MDLYAAIKQMRELSDRQEPFSFSFMSCSTSTQESRGIVDVRHARLRPRPHADGNRFAELLAFFRARQLEGLNEKMERTLQEKRDAEHFLKVLAPKYKTVIVVDLQEDTVRPVIVPDDFQSVLDTCGGSFRAALTNYRDTLVAPEDRENFAKLFDFGLVRSTVFSSNLLEHRYRKTDGRSFCIRVTPYSRSGSHINEVLWIFADEDVE